MNDLITYSKWDAEICMKMYARFHNIPEGVIIMKIGRLRVMFVRHWFHRAYRWWFNVKYPDGDRRICVPFLTIDILAKQPKEPKHKK